MFFLLRFTGNDLVDHIFKLIAQEDGHNGGRGFIGSQTVIVSGSGCGGTQKIPVEIHCPDDGGKDCQEKCVLSGIVAGFKKILFAVGDAPVVVFTASVDTGKGLFVQQADHSVTVGNLTQYFHDQHIVVNGKVHIFKNGSYLKLGGGGFIMSCFCRDPQFPEFKFHFGHECKDSGFDGAEIMIFQLLMFGRRGTEKSSACLDEVGPVEIEIFIHKEIFLFRPQCECDVFFRKSETFCKSCHRLLHSLDRTQ